MSKDQWIADFVAALAEIRPDIGRKFAWTIATIEWPQCTNIEPKAAALRWSLPGQPAK